MDYKHTQELVEKEFDSTVIKTLFDYIKIDNLSPNFDKEWATNGKDYQAAKVLLDWALK